MHFYLNVELHLKNSKEFLTLGMSLLIPGGMLGINSATIGCYLQYNPVLGVDTNKK